MKLVTIAKNIGIPVFRFRSNPFNIRLSHHGKNDLINRIPDSDPGEKINPMKGRMLIISLRSGKASGKSLLNLFYQNSEISLC